MFTVLGFSAEQMGRLREEFAIYGVADGRINIAGLTERHSLCGQCYYSCVVNEDDSNMPNQEGWYLIR